MVPSLSIVSTASLTSRMTVTMEACGGEKRRREVLKQSFKVKNARHGVSQGSPLTTVTLLMAAHYCQPCLLLAQFSLLADFDVWGQCAYNRVHINGDSLKICKENIAKQKQLTSQKQRKPHENKTI